MLSLRDYRAIFLNSSSVDKSSSRTELVERLNSFDSSLKYELVLGLKKNLIRSFILVFDEISPLKRSVTLPPNNE